MLHKKGNLSYKSSLIVISLGIRIIIRFAKHSRWLMYKIILLNILFTLLINKQTMHNIRNLIIHHFHIYEVAN